MKKSLLTTLILLAFSGSASAYSAGGGYVSNGFQDERNKSHGTQVAIGLHSNVYATNGTALGRNANVMHSAMNGTALGMGARVEAIGALAIQSATAKGINSVAIGGFASTDGNYSIAMGSASKTTNGGIAIGSSSESKDGIAIGTITSATGGDAISLGKKANSSSKQGIAVGVNANTASNEDYLRIISLKQINLETNRLLSSFDSSLSQEEQQKISEQLADLERQKYEIQNALEEAKSSNQKSSPNQISIGSDAISGNENSVAIGSSASSGVANGIALGSSSMADTEAGVVGYLANGETSSTWQSTFGALSIGDVANDITRQINGVAAGTEDTDAVNVAQLKVVENIANKAISETNITVNKALNIADNANMAANEAINKADIANTTANEALNKAIIADKTANTALDSTNEVKKTVTKGFNVLTDEGTTTNYQLGDTVTITGDNKNISTATSSSGVQVKLANDVSVNSVTTGKVSISANGINAGGRKVTNIDDGEVSPTSMEAVNGSQLYATNQQVARNTQSIEQIRNTILNTSNQVRHLERQVVKNRKRADAGTASSAAMASIPQAMGAGKSTFGIGLGNRGDQSAIAVGYSRATDNGKHILKLNLGIDTQDRVTSGVGYAYQW